MERLMPVLGIGGLFIRARDPDALARWYAEHLGVGPAPGSWAWETEGGPLIFQPFKADSDYFAVDRQVMLNLRVADLDGLIASLTTAGVAVETRAEWDSPEAGRFARVRDPEGSEVELWEPPAD
jgi:glyoxylase I family protein